MEYAVPWTGRCSSGSVLPSIQVEAVSCTAIHLQGSVPSSEADVRCVRWESFETNVAYGGTQKAMEFLASHLSPPPPNLLLDLDTLTTTKPSKPVFLSEKSIKQVNVKLFKRFTVLISLYPPPPPGKPSCRRHRRSQNLPLKNPLTPLRTHQDRKNPLAKSKQTLPSKSRQTSLLRSL